MTIKRYPGKAFGRSESVEHNGSVYTAVIAPDLSADFRDQTRQALEQLDANLAGAGTDRTRLLSVYGVYHGYGQETDPQRGLGRLDRVGSLAPARLCGGQTGG